MSKITDVTPTFKRTLAALGKDYEAKVIDREVCGYRNIKGKFDIEISGMNNSRTVRLKFTVYLWHIANGTHRIGSMKIIDNIGELKHYCDNLASTWGRDDAVCPECAKK